MPLLQRSSIDYNYISVSNCGGCNTPRKIEVPYPRGKSMGGSSTINGMWYVRGNKQDYDDWVHLGNYGWSYQEVLPYFKKSEDLRDRTVSCKIIEFVHLLIILSYRSYNDTNHTLCSAEI